MCGEACSDEPYMLHFEAAGGVFLPSRGSVINNSSILPDSINPDLVKPVLVVAMVYSAGSPSK